MRRSITLTLPTMLIKKMQTPPPHYGKLARSMKNLGVDISYPTRLILSTTFTRQDEIISNKFKPSRTFTTQRSPLSQSPFHEGGSQCAQLSWLNSASGLNTPNTRPMHAPADMVRRSSAPWLFAFHTLKKSTASPNNRTINMLFHSRPRSEPWIRRKA